MSIMVKKQDLDYLTTYYESIIDSNGEDGLYTYLLDHFTKLIEDDSNLEIRILENSENFFQLYRQTGEDIHFTLGKILRRVSHSIYRKTLKFYKNKRPNYKKFINII